jgi:septal ring factor EnvC (AmiA/AmiB activator)
MLSHEAEKATWDTKITEFKHQIDEFKSKNDRLQANLEAKEQQIGRLQQENKQARRNYMTAQKNTDTHMGAAVGS